ncbi:MAG: ComEC/Rec2 family competence protein [bacterium]|nr:ComEC/Rec2 family competence protein [bacterium]
MKTRSARSRIEHLLFAVLLAFLGWIISLPGGAKKEWDPAPVLTVTVLDVGQGDSIFIQTPSGEQMLVDGGPDDAVLSKIGRLMPWNDRTIEMVVLTHPHADHASGLVSVLERYQVGKIILADVSYPSAISEALQNEINRSRAAKEIVSGATDFSFGGVDVHVLAPNHDFAGEHLANVHDAMVVLKLTYGTIDFLLTGDMEAEGETALIDAGSDISAEVLKVGHHGSKTSTTKEFLDAVHPEYTVISAGEKNRYHHPHPSVLLRLENFGAKILRTDEIGDVRFTTNGSIIDATTSD